MHSLDHPCRWYGEVDAVDWPSETPSTQDLPPSQRQPRQCVDGQLQQRCQALKFPAGPGQPTPLCGQKAGKQQLYVERKLHRAKWTGETSMKVWRCGGARQVWSASCMGEMDGWGKAP